MVSLSKVNVGGCVDPFFYFAIVFRTTCGTKLDDIMLWGTRSEKLPEKYVNDPLVAGIFPVPMNVSLPIVWEYRLHPYTWKSRPVMTINSPFFSEKIAEITGLHFDHSNINNQYRMVLPRHGNVFL